MQELLKLNGTLGQLSAEEVEMLTMYIIADKAPSKISLDVLRDYIIYPESATAGISVYDYQARGNGGVRSALRAKKIQQPLGGSSGNYTFTQAGLDTCRALLARL